MKRRTCAVLAVLLGAAISWLCHNTVFAVMPLTVYRADAVPIELRERYESLIGTNIGYTLADAKADGCMVFEGLDISAGWDDWDAFLAKVSAGEPAELRQAHCHSPFYPSPLVLPDDTRAYTSDIVYNGRIFTEYSIEGRDLRVNQYRYLYRLEGEETSETAIFTHFVKYVLVKNYPYIERRSISLNTLSGAPTVYWEFTYKDEAGNKAHKRPA